MVEQPRKKIDHGMVLAAGLGTRMRPITNTLPKPLVEVDGRTILDRNIDLMHGQSVQNIAVNGHHLFPVMQDHMKGWKDHAMTLVSEEDELLDQGGGIKNALQHLGGSDFFVLNGDAFWEEDRKSNLAALEEAWTPKEMDFLLLVAPLEITTGYHGVGDFFLDHENRISFRGEAESAPYVFTGVGIYKSSTFEAIDEKVFPLVPLYKQAVARGRLFAQVLEGHWFHIGTPDAIGLAEAKLEDVRASKTAKL